MKSFLYLILLFCCHFTFAQNSESIIEKKLKQDSTTLRSYNLEKNISDSASVSEKTKVIDNKKSYFDTEKDTDNSIANQHIDIVQEINAVLNYKINRIWRKDLYCLVCKNLDVGRVA